MSAVNHSLNRPAIVRQLLGGLSSLDVLEQFATLRAIPLVFLFVPLQQINERLTLSF